MFICLYYKTTNIQHGTTKWVSENVFSSLTDLKIKYYKSTVDVEDIYYFVSLAHSESSSGISFVLLLIKLTNTWCLKLA